MRQKKMLTTFRHSRMVAASMLMSFCMTGAVFAQKAVIKGNVVDENGEPIIGANILVKGSTNGTITDINGNYSLEVENAKNTVTQSYTIHNIIKI